jgi:hypothetical protein
LTLANEPAAPGQSQDIKANEIEAAEDTLVNHPLIDNRFHLAGLL